MTLYYVAHRLFAAHDRALAAALAHRLAQKYGSESVFLPFCDTDEESLVADCKGRRLFELDSERLSGVTAMAALLHGPSLDDGVCMEIGYAAARGIPVIAVTSDFQTYGPDPAGLGRILFPDPLLPAVVSGTVKAHRLGSATGDHPDRYAAFLAQNLATVEGLLDQAVQALDNPLHLAQPFPAISGQRMAAYLEPSPYAEGDRIYSVAELLHEAGWDVHLACRFDGPDVLEGASVDWTALSRCSLAIVDIAGPETPSGAAVAIGACVAAGRPIYAPDPGGWWTFADGREPNYRNLMIQYGLTDTFNQPEQLVELLLGME